MSNFFLVGSLVVFAGLLGRRRHLKRNTNEAGGWKANQATHNMPQSGKIEDSGLSGTALAARHGRA